MESKEIKYIYVTTANDNTKEKKESKLKLK